MEVDLKYFKIKIAFCIWKKYSIIYLMQIIYYEYNQYLTGKLKNQMQANPGWDNSCKYQISNIKKEVIHGMLLSKIVSERY